MSTQSKTHKNTQVLHAGQAPDPTTGAIMPPIYATSTFVQPYPGQPIDGYDYSRAKNPTRQAYEDCVAGIEEGTRGLAFASGLAAISAILDLLEPGDHVIGLDDLYGGTFRLFDRIKQIHSGLSFSFVDGSNLEHIKQALTPRTKMIFVETPSNPLLKLVDLQAIADFAQAHNLIAVADNTFATPLAHIPLRYGFDIVVHSATKYLNGHSDIIGGVLAVRDENLADQLAFIQFGVGAIASPFDSYMILRGIKTLGIRMQRHSENAMAIAEFLHQHPKVKRVIYPGHRSHPQHELAKRQMNCFGGMISFELDANLQSTLNVIKSCQIFALAESLGGVESLIEHPALMTHASIPENKRKEIGISDSLIRLSVGIEHIDDLINDLAQALEAGT